MNARLLSGFLCEDKWSEMLQILGAAPVRTTGAALTFVPEVFHLLCRNCSHQARKIEKDDS